MRKKNVLIPIVIGLLLGYSVFYALGEPTFAKPETSKVIVSLPWGDNPGEIGLVNLPEHETCGPLSFCTDGKNVFVLDTVHKQVVRVNTNGERAVIAGNVLGWDICADDSGGVFVRNDETILHINKNGNVKKVGIVKGESGKIPKIIQGYGNELYVDSDGYLCTRELTQKVYRISGVPRMSDLAFRLPDESLRSLHYQIKRFSGNTVRILGIEPEGKVKVSVTVKINDGTPGAVLFKGIDSSGNLYVEVENLKGNSIGLEVHRYAPSGKLLALFKMPNDYFTTVYKKTQITPDGSVYQMLTTPEGVSIIRY